MFDEDWISSPCLFAHDVVCRHPQAAVSCLRVRWAVAVKIKLVTRHRTVGDEINLLEADI